MTTGPGTLPGILPGIAPGTPAAPAIALDLALDPEQAAAAHATERGVQVTAGAGTGKTRTIVGRLSVLVRDLGIPPKGIVVATYTNKAAHEIRGRASALLGEEVGRGLRMGTFHSIGAGILRRHARAAGLPANFTVLAEDDADRLLRDVVTIGGHVGADSDPGPMVETASRTIRRWKSWGLTVADVESPDRDRRSDEEERLARVYVAYEHELHRRGYVDFADLCLLPYALMEADPEVFHAEANGVRHLLVDEAQDANAAQVLLARKLSAIHGNVFAVGDADQSIYSFQGGYPGAIGEIAGPARREFTLARNRRCTRQILAPAIALVGRNRRAAPKALESDRDGAAVALISADSERDEGQRVVARIKELRAAGAPLSEICVLARSAFALSGVEEALVKAGIPYDLNGGVPFSDREEVRDVVAYLRLAAFDTDRLAFERIANKPVRGVGPQALDAIMRRQSAGEGMPFHQACATLTDLDGVRLGEAHRQGLSALARGLQALANGYADGLTTAHLLAMVLDERGLGYEPFVAASKEKARRRKLDNLAALRRIAQEEQELGGFVDRIVAQAEEVPDGREHVRLSTMHSSKGLEFDHVVCVGFDSAVIPSPKALEAGAGGSPGDPWDGPRGGGVEEERRLAHVAFTRPRRTLDVAFPLTRSGRAVTPSSFLFEAGLDPYLGADPFADRPAVGGGRSAPRGGAGRKGFGKEAGKAAKAARFF